MRTRLLVFLGPLALLALGSCSAPKEARPPSAPVPEAAYRFGDVDPAFGRLAVVNDEPYADMYFKHFGVNPTIDTEEEDTSTFAVDVDTASYSMVRSYLERGHLPDEAAVRVEEFVNKFDYSYRTPEDEAFSVQVEAFPSPNRRGYHLLHVGLKGREIARCERKSSNLVFVIDVSGSMDLENRLGLVKRALGLLLTQLEERDSVGIVVYGTEARTVLEPTYATARGKKHILAAIERLRPEGSTNAQAGLKLGYAMAARHFERDKINRVILCSDGVANNGITSADGIHETIRMEAEKGVTISTVGFGMGNYNDVLMERLADIGNGNYAYVDRIQEAHRIFVEELTGTLQVIARDVKVQLQFDKARVSRYRLIGFENRMLEKEDFENDAVDGGEIGAGHAVTALYEVKFRGGARASGSFATIRIRHNSRDDQISTTIEREVPFAIVRPDFASASPPAKLSMVAAVFAEKLRGSYWVRHVAYEDILELWEQIPLPQRGAEEVRELHELVLTARDLDRRGDKFETDLPLSSMDFDRLPVLK